MPASITVRGHHRSLHAPERGTVRVAVSVDGADANAVFESVTRSAEAVTRLLDTRHDADRGPVTSWSSDQVRTWSQRPWNDQGAQLPLVHHARVDFEAEFVDPAALGAWVDDAVLVPGLSIVGTTWTLTEPTRSRLEAVARRAAVLDGRDRAQQYADALSLGPVTVEAIADLGMLPAERTPGRYVDVEPMARGLSVDEDRGAVELDPRDIEIEVWVDAVFRAGD
jgi:uncharacterized protein YggE